jgi:mevalonate kinase
MVALGKGEIDKIGKLMDENHLLLREIGVSREENEKIIEIARNSGALGAKLTGGGGGGSCIALAKDEKHAHDILNEIKKNGFTSFVTKVEASG